MEKPERIVDIFKTTKIWEYLSAKAAPKELALVEELVNDAIGILDRIIETFPTYTLHNGQHQLNILKNYDKILGEKLKDLTDLEAALLILSAFYHDIGMVFRKDEKDNLKEEDYFNDFLAENDRAILNIAEDKGIGDVTAEWYCRWSHAKRVWKYLKSINNKLYWEGINFRKELGQICVSHNEETKWIKTDDNLSSNFWNKTDLRFCAILLRLSDVLDFDDTRTPKSVFNFLELDKPKSKNEEISRVEWEKHFASRGFSFDDWNQESHYTIDFKAAPKSPSIEHDINEFLNYIEKEFHECSSILSFCSNRWKKFKLPNKINRQDILSQGYTFGDFRFSLDQEQVLSLLMGKSLYENKYVFVREVIQNAIDTSRHREFYEKNREKHDFVSKSINVSTWYDSDGYRWIKIDDYGMGMTYSQVLKYFLKVGNSYYNSDEFKVEKLKYKTIENDFLPISRFGIGILSCFIAGDVVEVNTRSVFADGKEMFPIRLSLKGIHNYYVLQSNKDIPSLMPDQNGFQSEYRKEPGTSIAIRINPNNDLPNFNLSKILDKILFNPKITVNLIDKGKKGQYLRGLDIDSTEVAKHKLSSKDIQYIERYVNDNNIRKIDIEIQIIPVNLNGVFSHPDIKGFLNIILLEPKIELIEEKRKHDYNHYDHSQFSLRYSNYSRQLNLIVRNPEKHSYNNGNTSNYSNRQEISVNLSSLIEHLELFHQKSVIDKFFDSILLSHNGIIISNKKGSSIQIGSNYGSEPVILGYIELNDKLRPNLSVSRSKIISVPWLLWSNLNFTIRRNIPDKYSQLKKIDFLKYHTKVDFSYRDLNEDYLLLNKEYWPSEKIFEYDKYSLIDILNSDVDFRSNLDRNNDVESILKRKLIELYAKYKITLLKETNKEKHSLLKKITIKESDEGLVLCKPDYPPLTFCEYENFDGLMPEKLNKQIFNINHPFSRWLIKSYVFLDEHFSNHLYILMENTDISIINNTLNKLREHLPSYYKPSVDLFLTEDDFKIDFDKIPMKEN